MAPPTSADVAARERAAVVAALQEISRSLQRLHALAATVAGTNGVLYVRDADRV